MFAQVIVESSQCLEPSFIARYIDPVLPYCGIINCFLTFGALLIARMGLKQISLARQTAIVNAKRDALKIAAEQCQLYADKIILPASELLASKVYSEFNKSYSFSVKDSSIIINQVGADVDHKAIFWDDDFIRVFNAIESFSQYFTSGLADEEDAYNCLGNVHLKIVSPFIPLLVLRDQKDHEHNWRNTLKLFVNWYSRQQQEIIERKKHELSEAAKLLEKEKESHNPEPISILDVDTFYKWNSRK